MKPTVLVALAGLPHEIWESFVTKLNGHERVQRILTSPKLSRHEIYTSKYADDLYDKVAAGIRTITPRDRREIWACNLVTLYVSKGDGSERVLLNRLGVESLVYPLRLPVQSSTAMVSSTSQVTNVLFDQAKEAVDHSTRMLKVISREVKDNSRTMLLLPEKNYGKDFASISRCVQCAAALRTEIPDFIDKLREIARKLRTDGRHYKGDNGLSFVPTIKARGRHGNSPTWDDGHATSCVIRGRLRFGAPFDPKFHYDCRLSRDAHRQFPNCHGKDRHFGRKKTHVNIAPNDNVR